jgi:exopolyphosphatase/guanosine-5'-triphosphate,3'-diphosphate pyrophosphatase
MSRAVDDRSVEKVIEFGRECGFEERHCLQVTRLVLAIFDQAGSEFGLGGDERFLLNCASILHDIGWSAGSKGHHKSSMNMILASEGLGFEAEDKIKIGLIARYHRKALPKKKHKVYDSLSSDDKYVVSVLGGMLRIADGLDRSHLGLVKSVNCEVRGDVMIIECESDDVLTAELFSARKKSDLLSKTIERDILLR